MSKSPERIWCGRLGWLTWAELNAGVDAGLRAYERKEPLKYRQLRIRQKAPRANPLLEPEPIAPTPIANPA